MEQDQFYYGYSPSLSQHSPMLDEALQHHRQITIQAFEFARLAGKSKKRVPVKFYSGEASFRHELTQNGVLQGQYLNTGIKQPKLANKVQTDKQPKQFSKCCLLFNKKQKQANFSQTMIKGLPKKHESIAQSSKHQSFQSYSNNRMSALENPQLPQISQRKMHSISSRKYQPINDYRDIFEDEELENSSLGLDQTILWRHLMNKYFLQQKIKKKTIEKQKPSTLLAQKDGKDGKLKQETESCPAKQKQDGLNSDSRQDFF